MGLHPDGKAVQRQENGKWRDFLLDGEQVTWPFDLESLPSGKYRLDD
jgi:hypothetical protein